MGDGESRPLVAGRLRDGQWHGVDTVAAVLLALAFGASGTRSGGWGAGAVAAVVWLPVAVRRRRPVGVLYTVLAGAVLALAFTGWEESWIPVGVALYTVAAREPRRRSATALGCSLGAVAAAMALVPRPVPASGVAGDVVFASVMMTLPWLVGTALREQRSYAELAARQAVTDERLRIARELHDVVAHHLTVIAVRAEVARAVAAADPQEAERTLALVGTAGRTALTEMRRMLGVLRSPGDGAELGSAPGLADLPALANGAGPRVELSVDPGPPLPPGVELAVYRIVQEALTNVVRHAGSADCRVHLSRTDPGAVEIEVVNDAPARTPSRTPSRRPGGGHGLVGMRERAATCGGTLSAGPLATGGFRVHARLPCGSEAAR
ncbi:sensor histidine kinase [Kitasatospora sp. CB02891]|uniref:sensor histidine kinase n=1 Tax=Kitasatospora sp. CB02891 TaxID=2020329 RepID=UPI000C277C90|nr:sensor histidine kinase [Kitasatospora sp. CB02891]PJN27855.1 two-component sensor histidine kinase [Kitasatospora sp. CB02891]